MGSINLATDVTTETATFEGNLQDVTKALENVLAGALPTGTFDYLKETGNALSDVQLETNAPDGPILDTPDPNDMKNTV